MNQNKPGAQMHPNPWLHMWLRPKSTVIASQKKFTIGTCLLVWILGVHIALNYAQNVHDADFHSLSYIIGISLVRAVFYGAVIWLVYSALVYWIGKLFGGSGTWRTVLHGMALAQVPIIAYLIIYWPLALAVFGVDLFSSAQISLSAGQMMLNLLAMLINFILGVWYIITSSKAIAGAHNISGGKGFLIFICMMIIIALLLIVSILMV